ncbi:MAG: DUF4837 family protein [candidate division WOR-3 bacterium]|nr:DUF4837 family protein [candidate division WOR-3 bacterium]
MAKSQAELNPRWLTSLLVGTVLLALACSSTDPRLFGPLREVTVISAQWDELEPTVRSILQEPVPTPQPEPEFKVRVGSAGKFETYSRFRVVFLIGTSRDTLIRQILGARADSLSEGDFGLLKVPNPWFKNQFALIFIARDTSKLVAGLHAYAGRIRQTLRGIGLDQMTKAVYIEGVDRNRTDELSRKYAFTIDVPRRWLVNEDNAAAGFVYLYGHMPDRNVFVHWQDTTRALVPDSMAGLRDYLTGRFYDGDSIDRQFLQAETIAFLAGPCVRLSGVWKNDREVIGGPFVNYSFNFRGRFYMVDGLVFNPGKMKLDALTQTEAVVRTLTPR